MRPLFMLWVRSAFATLLVVGTAEAAAIKGRVVDTNGKPVAGAEIRVWQKGRPVGGRMPNEPVSFDGVRTISTDESGQFSTPDVFNTPMPVRVVAQVKGMLAGRSAWITPIRQTDPIDDIVLVRLTSSVGRVIDSQGRPVAGALVFNAEGHERVEAKTGSTGKFFLDRVPEGALFLFAEKEGYRLTGTVLGAGDSVELRLLRSDEAVEPLSSHDPVLSYEERAAIARRLLDPYLELVSRQGDDLTKRRVLDELATIDPSSAYDAVDRIGFVNPAQKDSCRNVILSYWMNNERTRDVDKLRLVIESSPDEDRAAFLLIQAATYSSPLRDRDRKRDWLDSGLAHARGAQAGENQAKCLAIAAEGLWRMGDSDRAAQVALEAEAAAKKLQRPLTDYLVARLARIAAPTNLDAALGWLDGIKNESSFAAESSYASLLAAPFDATKAEAIWNHVADRVGRNPAALAARDRLAADVSFSVARTDINRARRIAVTPTDVFWRTQALGAVACAADEELAKELFREAIADPALLKPSVEDTPFGTPKTAAATLAGLLPLAEQVDPGAGRELLWHAISLRPVQPLAEFLDDEVLRADVALAQMLARFEPSIARAMLQPPVVQLPQLAAATYRSAQLPMRIVVAAAYVNPQWAVELLDSLPDPPDASSRQPKHEARLFLARMLGMSGNQYWKYAGFWEPEE